MQSRCLASSGASRLGGQRAQPRRAARCCLRVRAESLKAPAKPEAQQQETSTSQADSEPRRLSTAEWQAKYERDGMVDLWLEEEFNAGSRLIGGRATYLGRAAGMKTGEGPSCGDAPTHRVKIHNRYTDEHLELEVPEDRYILYEAEDQGLTLPWACRMGCCTQCAVRVKSGDLQQTEALGISAELKERGYALMCVGFPASDLELETVTEDEVYDLQFGLYFAKQALDPNAPSVQRDDYALEIAQMDE